MIVVADSGPLYYLILLEHIDLLRRFYGHVLVPEPVAMNCPLPAHQPSCGSESRTGPPGSMRRVPPVAVSTITDDLDLGERAAIRAMRLSATRSFFPPAPFQGGPPVACEGSFETASTRRWRACSCTPPGECRKTLRVQRGHEVPEAFLYRRLDTLTETSGRFRLNVALPIPFDGFGTLEVDLLCADARVVIELDGEQHLADPVAYRRDRRKDQLLQENGYFVLRFLAEDVGKELDAVLDAILRVLGRRRQSAAKAEPLKFVRRGGE